MLTGQLTARDAADLVVLVPRSGRPALDIVWSSVYTSGMTHKEMREPTALLLTALAGGRLHGYGIITEVERLSGGRVRLRAGTLYAALDRLSAEGLVGRAGEEVVAGRLRRYYALTEAGASALREEAERRQSLAGEAIRRLRLTGGLA